MKDRKLSRRTILAAIAATGGSASALALANGKDGSTIQAGSMALNQAYNVAGSLWIGPDSAKSNVSADTGRVYMASDTQVEYYGDSGSWVKLGVGSSTEPVPSVTTDEERIGKSIEISTGGALNSEISSLLSSGYTDIFIRPKEDGSAWAWDSKLTLDPSDYGGVSIQISEYATVHDNTTGYSLLIDTDDGLSQQLKGQTFSLVGGRWLNQAADPSGWVRAKDAYGVDLLPKYVADYTNSAGDSTAISPENHSEYCEGWRVGGRYDSVDRGIDFKPASVTGGPGTESFADWILDQVVFDDIQTAGIRTRGDCHLHSWIEPVVFVGGDNANCYEFDGSMAGTIITSLKAETTNSPTDTTAFNLGPSFDNPPVLHSPIFSEPATAISRSSTDQGLPQVKYIDNANAGVIKLGDIGRGEFSVDKNGGIISYDGTTTQFQTDANGQLTTFGGFSTNSPIDFNDGFRKNLIGVKSSDYTTTPADQIVRVDTSSNTVTITLSGTHADEAGVDVVIKDYGGNAGTNAITVDSETGSIDGQTSKQITTNYGSLQFFADGASWFEV